MQQIKKYSKFSFKWSGLSAIKISIGNSWDLDPSESINWCAKFFIILLYLLIKQYLEVKSTILNDVTKLWKWFWRQNQLKSPKKSIFMTFFTLSSISLERNYFFICLKWLNCSQYLAQQLCHMNLSRKMKRWNGKSRPKWKKISKKLKKNAKCTFSLFTKPSVN